MTDNRVPAPITSAHKTEPDIKSPTDKANYRLLPHQKLEIKRFLASGEMTRSNIARKYGVTPGYITQFADRYASEILEIKDHLTDEWAGLWAANKRNRISAYQDEIERLNESKFANHHEWSKARQSALRSVAEELGDLPPRQTTFVQTVVHIVEGFSDSDLEKYLT